MDGLTILAIALWMVCGGSLALAARDAAMLVRGRRVDNSEPEAPRTVHANANGLLLDKPCSVELHGEWTGGWTCVAVSRKGAVAVRREGAKARWIPKEQVGERVRWEE